MWYLFLEFHYAKSLQCVVYTLSTYISSWTIWHTKNDFMQHLVVRAPQQHLAGLGSTPRGSEYNRSGIKKIQKNRLGFPLLTSVKKINDFMYKIFFCRFYSTRCTGFGLVLSYSILITVRNVRPYSVLTSRVKSHAILHVSRMVIQDSYWLIKFNFFLL